MRLKRRIEKLRGETMTFTTHINHFKYIFFFRFFRYCLGNKFVCVGIFGAGTETYEISNENVDRLLLGYIQV